MVSAVVKYDHNSPDSRQEIGKLPGSVSGSLRGCHLDMILMSPMIRRGGSSGLASRTMSAAQAIPEFQEFSTH